MLTFQEKNFYKLWIQDAYEIQDKIQFLQEIIEDDESNIERKAAAQRELDIQNKDFANLKQVIYSFKNEFNKVLWLKYVEGYTLEEIVPEVNYGYTTIKDQHSKFTKFLNGEIKAPDPVDLGDFKGFLKNLQELINPKYETCCENCGDNTVLSSEFVRKLYNKESHRDRVKGRS